MENKLNTRISLLVPCQLASRDAVSSLVEHICIQIEKEGEPEGFRHQIVSAFNEAFNNLARHGEKELKNANIMIVVEVTSTLGHLFVPDRSPTVGLLAVRFEP